MSAAELGCSYAAMILDDDGISVTGEKIATLLKAANLTVESYWPSLFAKLCEKRNVEDLVMNVGAGGAAAHAAVSTSVAGSVGCSAASAALAVEEKKEEPKDESDDDLVFGLFD